MHSNAISLDASQHPLKSVTIFQSSTALLTRTFTVGLRSGRNVIEISGLSSNIDVESPRIHGLGSHARIVDVCCDIAHATSSKTNQLTENSSRKGLSVERALWQQEYDALEDATSSLLRNMNPANLDNVLDGIVERKRKAMKAVLELDQKIVQIEREVQLVCKKHKGSNATVVSATVLAEHDCDVELYLSYLVSGATWTPHYDLRARTRDGQTNSDVTLHYCANIVQTTGEDWNDAAVILSTANSQTLQSLSVPSIEPLEISTSGLPVSRGRNQDPRRDPDRDRARYDVRYYARHRADSRSSRESPTRSPDRYRRTSPRSPRRRLRSRSPIVEDEPPRPVAPEQAGVSRSPVSLSYRIGEELSLLSDGLAHKLSIAALDLSAELKYVCVPCQTNAAYIEGTITNTSDYELLTGPVSVFMDNQFVTKSAIGHVSANESFTCVLGVDPALKVSYQQETRTEQEAPRNFADPTKRTTHRTMTTITNNHPFDISPLVVRAAIPRGDESGKVKVVLRTPKGLARAKDEEEIAVEADAGDAKDLKVRWTKVVDGQGGEKDGMYEWICIAPGGKKVALDAEWDVQVPAYV
ncbi:hypothetical protein C8Q74DRAFT_1194872 [Fomes fomentarius]|nr:hypothetical protein C8Q74DRAFT_1194872 [Fomes fomentarius]